MDKINNDLNIYITDDYEVKEDVEISTVLCSLRGTTLVYSKKKVMVPAKTLRYNFGR